MSPGNTFKIANRYTFLLLEAPATASEFTFSGLSGAALDENMAKMKSLRMDPSVQCTPIFGPCKELYQPFIAVDLGKLGAENPEFKVVRWNYMMVNGPN